MKKILLYTLVVSLFYSCGSDKSQGCTDPVASNYKSWVDFDDGSCAYQADVVFYYDAITANELNLEGFDRLDFYIEGESDIFIKVGSEYPIPSFIYAGIPNCYAETYVTEPIIWYSPEWIDNTIINYQVYGIRYVTILGVVIEEETLVDEYFVDLLAKGCTAMPIRYLSIQQQNTDK